MNLIVICLDTFRQDHVSSYHQGRRAFDDVPPCQTPSIDAFARDCVIFENATPCGMPTIPIRMELMTGQYSLPFRPWEPLHPYPKDITIAEILRREGYTCGLISDVYHYRAPGMNYHRGFHSYHWIRGQEYDPLHSNPTTRSIDDYVNERYTDLWRGRVAQFLANTDDFASNEDWFPARVVETACDWLKRNRSQKKLFCWIDSFDPHEPWDPPKKWDTYTDANYRGKRLILPMGGLADSWATKEEQRHIRGLYAGEAAFVDHCLSQLFACLRENGYFDDSVILLQGDHGHPLGDHGKFLKGADRLYSELLRVPFMIRMPDQPHPRSPSPGGSGRQGVRSALIQYPDILPTLLELLELSNTSQAMHGESFADVVRGESDTHRSATITGYHAGVDRCIRDGAWSYIQRPEGQSDELYNLRDDPRETNNLIDEGHEEAQRLSALFGGVWRSSQSRTVKGIQGQYEVASGSVE